MSKYIKSEFKKLDSFLFHITKHKNLLFGAYKGNEVKQTIMTTYTTICDLILTKTKVFLSYVVKLLDLTWLTIQKF
jgi:hypothetical protein